MRGGRSDWRVTGPCQRIHKAGAPIYEHGFICDIIARLCGTSESTVSPKHQPCRPMRCRRQQGTRLMRIQSGAVEPMTDQIDVSPGSAAPAQRRAQLRDNAYPQPQILTQRWTQFHSHHRSRSRTAIHCGFRHTERWRHDQRQTRMDHLYRLIFLF